RMRLPPLSEEAVRALAGRRDVDAGELYRVTGGNPFYVSEIIGAGWPSVPPTVRDAVGARLFRSSTSARRVGEGGAVSGGAGGPGAAVVGPWPGRVGLGLSGNRDPRSRRDRAAVPSRAG